MATRYDADDWNVAESSHDNVGVNDVSVENGLQPYFHQASDGSLVRNDSSQMYESAQAADPDLTKDSITSHAGISMADVKSSVYDAVKGMLFDDADSGWGHAVALLGSWYPKDKANYFGISFDTLGRTTFTSSS